MLYGSTGQPVYATNTYNAGQSPCHLTVRNDGTVVVVDNTGKILTTLSTPHAQYGPGQLVAGQYLTQVGVWPIGRQSATQQSSACLQIPPCGDWPCLAGAKTML